MQNDDGIVLNKEDAAAWGSMALTRHLDKSQLEKKENKQTQQLIETFHCSPQQLGKSPFLAPIFARLCGKTLRKRLLHRLGQKETDEANKTHLSAICGAVLKIFRIQEY